MSTQGLYEVITKTTEVFYVEADSAEHAQRMFTHGEFVGEADLIEDYEVLSPRLIQKNRE